MKRKSPYHVERGLLNQGAAYLSRRPGSDDWQIDRYEFGHSSNGLVFHYYESFLSQYREMAFKSADLAVEFLEEQIALGRVAG
jgi:hypothetical protein